MKKKILFILIILFAFIDMKAESLKEANNLYKKADYKNAAQMYESLIAKELESSSLYFNLGNSYYKMDMLAPAILNYERALLLNPSDNDIKYNLRMSKTLVKDKIDSIPSFFLVEWADNLVMYFNTDTWAIISIVSFLSLLLLLLFFFFSSSRRRKKILFSFSIALFVCVIMSNIFAYSQKKRLVEREYAIIFSPSVTLKGSPDDSGTNLFLLHEGTKVKIIEKLGEWTNIRIEDGNEGWLNSTDLQQI